MKDLRDYTESEFLSLVRKICTATSETEEDGNRQVKEFVRLAEHPSGTDLIFILKMEKMIARKALSRK